MFQGTGKLKGQYKLEIEENAKPVVHLPRRVPVALKGKLKRELERLQSLRITEKVIEPTPWVSSLVIVKKKLMDRFVFAWTLRTSTKFLGGATTQLRQLKTFYLSLPGLRCSPLWTQRTVSGTLNLTMTVHA